MVCLGLEGVKRDRVEIRTKEFDVTSVCCEPKANYVIEERRRVASSNKWMVSRTSGSMWHGGHFGDNSFATASWSAITLPRATEGSYDVITIPPLRFPL